MLAFQKKGAEVFDYGNNIRQRAFDAGVKYAFDFPGFSQPTSARFFCEGKGPFRWWRFPVTQKISTAGMKPLPSSSQKMNTCCAGCAWRARKFLSGLPARICWLGYGERAQAGLAFNRLVAEGKKSARPSSSAETIWMPAQWHLPTARQKLCAMAAMLSATGLF